MKIKTEEVQFNEVADELKALMKSIEKGELTEGKNRWDKFQAKISKIAHEKNLYDKKVVE